MLLVRCVLSYNLLPVTVWRCGNPNPNVPLSAAAWGRQEPSIAFAWITKVPAERHRERFSFKIKVICMLTLAPLRVYSDILSDIRRSGFQITLMDDLMSVNNQRIFIACFSFCYTMGYCDGYSSTHVYLLHYTTIRKGKGHPWTGHESAEGEWRNSSTLSLTSALDGRGWSTPRTGRFTPEKGPLAIVQKVECAPGPVWTDAENLAPHRDSIPGPSSP